MGKGIGASSIWVDNLFIGIISTGEVFDEEGDRVLNVDGEDINIFLEIVDAWPRNAFISVSVVGLFDDIPSVAGSEVDCLL